MKLAFIVLTILLISCSDHHDKSTIKSKELSTQIDTLEDTVRTVELVYIAWYFPCANWATAYDYQKYQDTGYMSEHTIFIEPLDSTLILPDTLGEDGDVIRFTGQFYRDKGYPKFYQMTEPRPKKAKIFLYREFKVIKSYYKDSLTLFDDHFL